VAQTALTPELVQAVQAGDQEALARLAQLNPQALQNLFGAQQLQRQNQQQQLMSKVTTERAAAIKRQGFIKQALKGGPEAIRNNLARIAGENKNDPDFDPNEIVELSNLAVTNPEEAESQLKSLLDGATAEIEIADQILRPTPTTTRVQSSKVLPDGTTVQVMSDGATRVTDPTGKEVTGKARAKAVRDAEAEGIRIQTKRAGGRAQAAADVELETAPTIAATTQAAKAAITRSEKAFDQIGKIRPNIANIDEAIRLIDEGAATGVVQSRLPSVRAASVELNNLQGRLGLDVVGNTTFGALSEAELNFALDVALPTNLDQPDLKRWLQRKKESQQKLVAYLERVATFMGTPGNTVKDFIELEKLRELDQQTQVDLQNLSDEELLQMRNQAQGQ
jgi:hypothetical protein